MRPIKTKMMSKSLEILTKRVFKRKKLGELYWAFETIVFHRSTKEMEWDRTNYDTEKEAREGHREMVAKWKAKPRKYIRDELAKIRSSEEGRWYVPHLQATRRR